MWKGSTRETFNPAQSVVEPRAQGVKPALIVQGEGGHLSVGAILLNVSVSIAMHPLRFPYGELSKREADFVPVNVLTIF